MEASENKFIIAHARYSQGDVHAKRGLIIDFLLQKFLSMKGKI